MLNTIVQVPAKDVLGQVGKGYQIAIEGLNEGRIGIGICLIASLFNYFN